MLDVAIRGARVLRESGLANLDIGIVDGRFAVLGADVGTAHAEIDATGLVALPAVIDTHVHFNEPGRTDWEGFAPGSAALAAGGGSVFCDMPLNSEPPLLDRAAFERKRAAAEAGSVTDFGLWGGLVPTHLDRLEELADSGVMGFKAFMSDSGIASFPPADDHTLWRGMQVAAERGLPVAVHAENDAITRNLATAAHASGRSDGAAWAATRPPVAETEAIARALWLAGDTGAKLHVVHVSTGRGAALVAEARSRGIDASCETCPHYLHFTEEDAVRIGTALKCAPPVRDRAERAALWSALQEGHIAFVASDHSPSPPEMKRGDDWLAAWGGVAGVQSTLAVLLEHHDRGDVGLPAIGRLVASAPARRYGLDGKGRIAEGFDADLVLVQRSPEPRTLTAADLHQRHPVSAYLGEAFHWSVRRTLRRGETIFADGTITARTKGRLLRPTPEPTSEGMNP